MCPSTRVEMGGDGESLIDRGEAMDRRGPKRPVMRWRRRAFRDVAILGEGKRTWVLVLLSPFYQVCAAISSRVTASHPNSEVKLERAEVVLRSETAREGSVSAHFACPFAIALVLPGVCTSAPFVCPFPIALFVCLRRHTTRVPPSHSLPPSYFYICLYFTSYIYLSGWLALFV